MGKKKERREREAREREAETGATKGEGFEARWSAKAGKHGGAAPFGHRPCSAKPWGRRSASRGGVVALVWPLIRRQSGVQAIARR